VAKALTPIGLAAFIALLASVDRVLFGTAASQGSARWWRLAAAIAVAIVVIAGLAVGAVLVAARLGL
jgi:hypothetical protein